MGNIMIKVIYDKFKVVMFYGNKVVMGVIFVEVVNIVVKVGGFKVGD